jgi:hypothetical protein
MALLESPTEGHVIDRPGAPIAPSPRFVTSRAQYGHAAKSTRDLTRVGSVPLPTADSAHGSAAIHHVSSVKPNGSIGCRGVVAGRRSLEL